MSRPPKAQRRGVGGGRGGPPRAPYAPFPLKRLPLSHALRPGLSPRRPTVGILHAGCGAPGWYPPACDGARRISTAVRITGRLCHGSGRRRGCTRRLPATRHTALSTAADGQRADHAWQTVRRGSLIAPGRGPGTRRCRRLTCAPQAARHSCRNTAIPPRPQTTSEVATGRPSACGGCPTARSWGQRHELVAEPSKGGFVFIFVALPTHDQSVVAGLALCPRLDYNDWHAARGHAGRERQWRRIVSSPDCIGTSYPMAREPTARSNSAQNFSVR